MISEWLQALIGGALIGCASLILLLGQGRIAGFSGIISTALFESGARWRWLFLIGTMVGGFIVSGFIGSNVNVKISPTIVIAGFLVGVGARIGNGCTSGHGICGVGRFSIRSVVATMIFMFAGILTATLFHQGL